ncbi:2Fe-2S iron-sulfur cluster binding domain-containing protein [Pseudomonas sp. BN505]|nr:2Fe-2S iron-sulfur cluster binding domain-containing protein [Pseudomonas sp. BN605]MDH4855124.1 2Fe-2S iron-sulfur cluster binding domain-containing protein [Pseudomonas sp. BN505]
MPMISVVCRDGVRVELSASPGVTLMESLRDSSVGDVTALCGGCCSCATCHVFVLEGGEYLPPVSSDEGDMLEGSLFRRANSRLACQVQIEDTFDGLTIEIAPEE